MSQQRGWVLLAAGALAAVTTGCGSGSPAAGPPTTTTGRAGAAQASPQTELPPTAAITPSTVTVTQTAAVQEKTDDQQGTARSVLIQKNPGWGLDRISQRTLPLNHSFRANLSGRGVTVYLVDTGLAATNPGFGGRARVGAIFTTSERPAGGADGFGVQHGTFVAALVGGEKTGVSRAVRIVMVKAIGGGEGEAAVPAAFQRAAIVRALDWIRLHAQRPAVVAFPLDLRGKVPAVDAGVRRLTDAGLTVVAAAGDAVQTAAPDPAPDACTQSPAGLSSVIAVAASTEQDRPVATTSLGRCVTVFAPGDKVTSISAVDPKPFLYGESSGSDWATGYGAGAAALYLQGHPSATPEQVKQWIIANSTKDALHGLPAGTPNRLLYIGGL